MFIRYLPAGVEVRRRASGLLDSWDLPLSRGIETARNQAKRPGAFKRAIAGTGFAYSLPKKQEERVFAYPRLDYLYEVYDPTPRRAPRSSRGVRPIG